MNNDTASKILDLIRKNGKMRPYDLLQYLDIKRVALHRQLLKLQSLKKIRKIGTPPRVFYELVQEKNITAQSQSVITTTYQKKLLEDFIVITPSGEYLEKEEAFIRWCTKQNLPIQKTLYEYERTRKKYDGFKKNGLIDGMYKLDTTFHDDVYLDKLYYLDFYSIERFGKTKLGQLVLYAKQSQNKGLIKELANIAKPKILKLIKDKNIDAICFVPPTIKREVQFMFEFEKMLSINLPKVKIEKIKMPIIVPQKTINKLVDRIENAESTLHVQTTSNTYSHILIIDDAIGSGATMNISAKMLKNGSACKKITGLGVTGSFKGFEVISEV